MCTNGKRVDPLESVEASLTAMAINGGAELADDTVRDRLRRLLVLSNQMQALLSAYVDAFHTRGLAEADGLRTTRAWLCAAARLSPHAATALLRRASVVRELPALYTAAANGSVGPDHVTKVLHLARNIGLARVREVDSALAEVAATGSPKDLQAACSRIRTAVDPDHERPAAAIARRDLNISHGGEMVHLRGQLDPEAGAALLTAIDALSSAPTDQDDRTPGQRRADALVELARISLHHKKLPLSGGQRPHIGVLVTPETLTSAQVEGGRAHLRPVADGPRRRPMIWPKPSSPDPLTAAGYPPVADRATIAWGGTVHALTAQRLACDSILYRVLTDPASGQPLDVGRSHRTAPSWIRRALHARDRGCRWPGCDAPIPWCDCHHAIPWAQGGSTTSEAMLLLCRWHHTKVHEGEWGLTYDAACDRVAVTRPDGTAYDLGMPTTQSNQYRNAA